MFCWRKLRDWITKKGSSEDEDVEKVEVYIYDGKIYIWLVII
jgi:hypothetical protein